MIAALTILLGNAQVANPQSLVGQKMPLLPVSGWVQAGQGESAPETMGKVIYIVFSTNGCYLCNVPMHYANMRYKGLKDQGFVSAIAMVGMNNAERAQKIKERKLVCPIVLDQDSALYNVFHCNGAPTTFLVDRRGIIRGVDLESSDHKKFEKTILDLLAEKAPSER